jgi:hypothetical protein
LPWLPLPHEKTLCGSASAMACVELAHRDTTTYGDRETI